MYFKVIYTQFTFKKIGCRYIIHVYYFFKNNYNNGYFYKRKKIRPEVVLRRKKFK